MSSDNPFSVPVERYVLPPDPRFHPSLPGDDERAPPKKYVEMSMSEKAQLALRNNPPVPQEQLFYVRLILTQANATSSQFREFEDVVSVKYEDHWLRIFDKTGDWTFPRDRVIEVQTTRQP